MSQQPAKKKLKQSSIAECFGFRVPATDSPDMKKISRSNSQPANKAISTDTRENPDASAEIRDSDAGPSKECTKSVIPPPLCKDDSTKSQGSTGTIELDSEWGPEEDSDFEAALEREATLMSQKLKQCDEDVGVGTAIDELRNGTNNKTSSPLKAARNHRVLVKLPLKPAADVPEPWPTQYKDRWDTHHVKMPCSPENLYPVEDTACMFCMPVITRVLSQKDKKRLEKRWHMIQDSLLQPLSSSVDIEVATPQEANAFFKEILPSMVKLALSLPDVCTHPLPLLKRQENESVTFSQQQAAALLANAFFCTFPRRNARQKMSEYSIYPSINFNTLFFDHQKRKDFRKREKLRCILNYFRRVCTKMPEGTITFTRKALKRFPRWNQSSAKLTRLHVTSGGTIEDQGHGMLQVDFANKYLGGGVLGHGCVQEEIRFMLCPEMILSRLVTEELDNNESLVMIGCERFSDYEGYGDSFRWTGDHVDQTPRDEWGRRQTEVVAIDALVFHSYSIQFRFRNVERELNKAFAGFQCNHNGPVRAVATGNWGCGAFGGDHRLKALLQLMACAEAGRDVCFFTFGDSVLRDDILHIHQFLKDKGLEVADMLAFIHQYEGTVSAARGRPRKDLFEFITSVYQETGSLSPSQSARSDSQSKYHVVNDSPDYAAETP